MIKVKNIEITNADWLDTVKSVIDEILQCDSIDEVKELDNMIINEDYLEIYKIENDTMHIDYQTPGGFDNISFCIVNEE